MKILFIQRKSSNCGVADYGRRLYDILKTEMDITMQEVESQQEINYEGYDIALYNYHYATLPFIKTSDTRVKHVALYHEAFQNHLFDLIIPVSELPRPIIHDSVIQRRNKIPVIGSFGFGFPDKNYAGIAKMVKEQFKEAVLNLHIPFADFGDSDGHQAKLRVMECLSELSGTEIQVEISHGMLDQIWLIQWLGQNDINVFNCFPSHGRGISSSIDYALSACRPIAVSNSEMYRHMPREICLDNATLPELITKGIEPLKPIYAANTHQKLIEAIKTKLQN